LRFRMMDAYFLFFFCPLIHDFCRLRVGCNPVVGPGGFCRVANLNNNAYLCEKLKQIFMFNNKDSADMKKHLLWNFLTIMMVGLLSVGFVSCNKVDDFSTSVKAADLVGWWKFANGGLEGKTIQFDANGTYNSPFTYLYGSNNSHTHSSRFSLRPQNVVKEKCND